MTSHNIPDSAHALYSGVFWTAGWCGKCGASTSTLFGCYGCKLYFCEGCAKKIAKKLELIKPYEEPKEATP